MQTSVACTVEQKGTCKGFIDVNGDKGPNKIIDCTTSGSVMAIWDSSYATCNVNSNDTADIFPIVFYDSTVELATNAAKAFFNAR